MIADCVLFHKFERILCCSWNGSLEEIAQYGKTLLQPDLPYQIYIPEYIIYLKYNNIYVIPYTYFIKLWMYFWILVSFYGLDVNNNDENL